MSKEKYLVVLLGSPRGGEFAWKSLYKYVLDFLNADLAVCTGKKWLTNQSFMNKATHDWTFEEHENWKDYYKEKNILNWQKAFGLENGAGLIESGLIHFAIKNIILQEHIETIKNYDFIIFSRFDQLYTDYHIRGFEDKIIIPDGEDYFGLHDRHAVLPADMAENYLNVLNYFVSNFENFINFDYVNCETVNMKHLESFISSENILRSKRIQFTCATKDDQTNWRKARIKVKLMRNLYLKYPDEFLDAINNLVFNIKVSKLSFQNLVFISNYYLIMVKIKFGKYKKIFNFRNI